MSRLVKGDCGSISVCEKIFVKWAWLVGILTTLIMMIGGISWAGSSKVSAFTNRLDNVESRVGKLEKVQADLDTIKTLLREK